MKPARLTTIALVSLFCVLNAGQAQAQFLDPGTPGVAYSPEFAGPVNHYLPTPPHGFYHDSPLHRLLQRTAHQSWLRLEWLHWEINDPGNELLGADVNILRLERDGGSDPRVPFDVSEPETGTSLDEARVADLNSMTLNDTPGIRGTLGTEFMGGWTELSFFGLEENVERVLFDNIAANDDPNIITSLLSDGSVSDSESLNLFNYDQSFRAVFGTQMWGAEANFIREYDVRGDGCRWEPLFGFRYINLDEHLGQIGVFNNGGTEADRTTRIRSRTSNHVYGPQVGLQVSVVHRRVSLAAQTRLAFALNNYLTQVRHTTTFPVENERSPFDENEREEEVDFTTVLQIGFNARVQCTQKFSLFGGYDFMWLNRVARAHETINYNSTRNGVQLVPDIGVEDDLGGFFVKGFSIGGEFLY